MLRKKDLNQKIKISENNFKLHGNKSVGFISFNLPARETCPFATEECKRVCFARDPQEMFENVYKSRNSNYEESLKDTFIEDMIKHIEYQTGRRKFADKKIYFRLHTSGDFYDQDYLDKWVAITDYFKTNNKIDFACYTKSLPFFKKYKIDNLNFKIVFSVLKDTPDEIIKEALAMGLQCFIALKDFTDKNGFKCKGDCSNCLKCYNLKDNKEKFIFIEYHGSRYSKGKSLVINGKTKRFKGISD